MNPDNPVSKVFLSSGEFHSQRRRMIHFPGNQAFHFAGDEQHIQLGIDMSRKASHIISMKYSSIKEVFYGQY